MLYFTCIDQGDKFYLSSEGSLVQFSGNKHMQLFLKVLCKSLRYLIDKENYFRFTVAISDSDIC